MSYAVTKNRIVQWLGIILIIGVFAGAYWYFQVFAGVKTGLVSPMGSLTSGMIGYWSFDRAQTDSGVAFDRSTNKYNGTLISSPPMVNGQVDQALDFDGSADYVTMGDQPNLDFGDTADFSISGWFYRDTFTTSDVIVSKRTSTGVGETGYSVDIEATDALVLRVSDGSNEFRMYTTATFTTAQWTHFSVVFDQDSAANTKFYINGQAVSTTTGGTITSISDLSNTRAFMVGNINDTSSPFDGKIDEVRVYNRVLTANEAQLLYEFSAKGSTINSSISQPQGTGRLDSGLGGYWALDNGSGTSATDASTNSYTGTLTNGPTWTTGQIGGAVAFDGTDDYIDTDNGSALDSLSEYSYAAWIYPTSANGFIIAKASGGGGSSGFRLTSSTLQGWRANFTAWSEARSTSSTTVSLNTWSHVVMTYSHTGDKKHHIYLNGVEVVYSEQDTNPVGLDPDSGFDYWIGRKQGSNEMVDVPFTGNIDEARIYNRPLSVSEVTQLYRLTAPTSTDTGLEGYWSFNGKDVSGTTAFDRSGAGNTGTLTGGPSITEGKLAQGLNFDGSDDYVSVADTAAFTQSALTLSFWKKNTNAASNSNFLTKSGGSNRSWSVQSSDAGRNIQFITSSSLATESEYGLTPNGGMAVGQWHHVVCVFNGAGSTNAERMQIYINGIAQSITFTGTIPATLVDNSHAVNIGGKQNTAGFLGAMDEVRIYNRALSAGEAKGLYDVGADDKTNSSVSQPQGTGRLDSGLAGYWKLDDGSGTSATDSSTSGNTGTIANGTWATGRVGGAVSFSSASATSINLGDPSSGVLDFGTGDFTISAWALSTGYVAQTSSYNVIISKNDTSGGNWGLAIDSNNKVYFHCAGFVGAPGSTTAINDGQWHHILGTRVAGVATLYVDGALQTGTQSCSGNVSNIFNFKIGDSDFTGRKFNGSIDEVRLYNRALSADEVAQLYRLNAPSGTDTSLKGYWSFNGKDMSGTTAYDRSGAGNTGTLSGPTIVEGKIGQGLSFDGVNDYVDLGTGSSIRYTTTGSIAVWVKTSCTGTCVIIGGNSDTEIGYNLFLESGTLKYRQNKFNEMSTPWTGVYNDGNWHFVVVSKSGANGTLYVDNVSKATSTGLTGSWGAHAIYLGNEYNRTYYFSGIMDEVRVYDRALTTAEIASLYNSSR